MKKTLIEGLESRNLMNHDDGRDHADGHHLGEDDLHPRGSSGDYQIGGRWSSTASGSTGSTGSPAIITWSIVQDGLSIPGFNGEPTAPSNLITRLDTKYGSSATWLPLFQSVFDRWSAVTGITYIYQATDDGATFGSASGQLGVRGDVRIGGHNIDGGFGTLAYNFYPGTGSGGDMVIDTNEFLAGGLFVSTSNNSRAFRNTLSHEHGHGMGLAHTIPVNNTKLMEPNLSTAFDGPQFDDILGAQSLYGDVLEKGTRNETATTATDLGTLVTGTNTILAQQISIANAADHDYFKFTVSAGKTVSFTATPEGTTYTQGPQNGTTASFNALAQGNLSLTLYNTNGTTVLQTATANGIGLSETLSNLTLQAGTYYVKVNIAAGGAAQMYKLQTTVVDGLGPPTTPDLSAASDLGLSTIDDITSDNTPTFIGTGPANVAVEIFDGVDLIASTTSDTSGNWSITTPALSDGVHSITGRTFDGVALSNASPALSITVDTLAPSITVSSYDRDLTQRVTLAFDEAISNQVTTGDLTLTNTTTSATVGIQSATASGGNLVSTVVFSGGLLANGRYTLSMATSAATDIAGNPLTAPLSLQFVQLAGDANADGSVNFDDLLMIAQNYNTSGKNFSQGNFNYDGSGVVDFSDLLILAQNYSVSLFQTASTANVATQSKRKTNKSDVLA